MGIYQCIFTITDIVFITHNRAFSELYLFRGEIYHQQANLEAARIEFVKIVYYKQNFKPVQVSLHSLY